VWHGELMFGWLRSRDSMYLRCWVLLARRNCHKLQWHKQLLHCVRRWSFVRRRRRCPGFMFLFSCVCIDGDYDNCMRWQHEHMPPL
jgi:hypothetical protein